MDDMSRPVPGRQPGSEPTLLPTRCGSAVSAVGSRAAVDRRRSAAASVLGEAERRNADERTLIELRRKVQSSELLSAATERLLWKMKFNGHLTILVQNGRVLKSGYEEGYFRRRNDLGGFSLDV